MARDQFHTVDGVGGSNTAIVRHRTMRANQMTDTFFRAQGTRIHKLVYWILVRPRMPKASRIFSSVGSLSLKYRIEIPIKHAH